jgi:hypothetical protein
VPGNQHACAPAPAQSNPGTILLLASCAAPLQPMHAAPCRHFYAISAVPATPKSPACAHKHRHCAAPPHPGRPVLHSQNPCPLPCACNRKTVDVDVDVDSCQRGCCFLLAALLRLLLRQPLPPKQGLSTPWPTSLAVISKSHAPQLSPSLCPAAAPPRCGESQPECSCSLHGSRAWARLLHCRWALCD